MNKIILIQNRLFVKGSAECAVCEHKFKFILPAEIIPFWDNFCRTCSPILDKTLKPGEIHAELMWDF